MTSQEDFFIRAEKLLDRLEPYLHQTHEIPSWHDVIACRWRQQNNGGWLQSIHVDSKLELQDLLLIEHQKKQVVDNTLQFLHGLPANNVLLWGPRGTGKSSLIRALLNDYHQHGLRLIEVNREHLINLPDILEHISNCKQRFIIFCDDLSFESNDPGYKSLKVVLDGSLDSSLDNALVYATSNRRHLMPESMQDNQLSHVVDTELHHNETIEETISLSERFGLWLSFHPFNQENYLTIVQHWVTKLGLQDDDRQLMEHEALKWALLHGSRSGRSAWQFSRDWVGKNALAKLLNTTTYNSGI